MGLADVRRENTRLCFDVFPGFHLHRLSPPPAELLCSPVNLDVCRPTRSCAASFDRQVTTTCAKTTPVRSKHLQQDQSRIPVVGLDFPFCCLFRCGSYVSGCCSYLKYIYSSSSPEPPSFTSEECKHGRAKRAVSLASLSGGPLSPAMRFEVGF